MISRRASLSVFSIPGLPLFAPGDDLVGIVAEALAAAGPVEDGDVIVIAQKVVSKVEGRALRLAQVSPGEAARADALASGKNPAVAELIRRESAALMRVRPGVIIARHRLGHVLANAGIDASNVEGGGDDAVLLWPADPDGSAAALREALEARFGVHLAVIVSDSLGRAWRIGTTGHAIGVAGMRPLRDRRGETDLFGRTLQATVIGVADEIAAAASLVMGEGAEGLPVTLVRGAVYDRDETAGAAQMLRPADEDLFP